MFGTCSLDGRQGNEPLPLKRSGTLFRWFQSSSSTIILLSCRAVNAFLKDAGIELILEANDVVNGYDLYLHHRPDVVIVDLAFVGDSLAGLTFVRRIRANDPRTRLVVLTYAQ